jgi:hypothetical protein
MTKIIILFQLYSGMTETQTNGSWDASNGGNASGQIAKGMPPLPPLALIQKKLFSLFFSK